VGNARLESQVPSRQPHWVALAIPLTALLLVIVAVAIILGSN
jgi:hypothetical protein